MNREKSSLAAMHQTPAPRRRGVKSVTSAMLAWLVLTTGVEVSAIGVKEGEVVSSVALQSVSGKPSKENVLASVPPKLRGTDARQGPKNVRNSTHPRDPSTTVSCDSVNCHPVEDGFRRHRCQDPSPQRNVPGGGLF
jgi:hypothetical protein